MSRSLLSSCLLLWFTLKGPCQDGSQIHSTAFGITENDLLPESIAFDASTQSFYVGSTRKGKIIKIAANGSQSTFVQGGQFGQWMVVGLKVNPERNELWFCSSGGSNLLGYTRSDNPDGRPAGVFRVDLSTGELIKKYVLEAPGQVHFFNDLVIDANGDVYVSHMFAEQAIYKIDREADELERFSHSEIIKYPNGIDISTDRQFLFVAHAEGIGRILLASGEVTNLDVPDDVDIKYQSSIDGLYFYDNSLIGIQSDVNKVTRYFLNPALDKVIKAKTLLMDHPDIDHPTTGVIIEDVLYFVANAQFHKVNQDGTLKEQLSDPLIMKLNLK